MKPHVRWTKLLAAMVKDLACGFVFAEACSLPASASALQNESNLNEPLLWIVLGALVIAGLAYIVGRSIGKARSRSSSTSETSPGRTTRNLPVYSTETEPNRSTPKMSAAEGGQAGQGRSGGRGIIVAQLQRIQARTSWLYTPAALERWWVQVPARLQRYSPVLSTAWVDGMYLTAWPRFAMLLSLLAAAFGFIEGASHWSFLTIDSTGSAAAPAVAFAQILPLLVIAAAIGSLSANAGLMLVLGYAVGDYVLAGPQVQISGATSLPHFFYLRMPQLISYFFFFMLAAVPILMAKSLLTGLNRHLKGADIPSIVLRTAAAALVQAALVYGWTLSAVMVIRIFWAWAGQNPPLTVSDYLHSTNPWLPATAALAVVLRGWFTFRASSNRGLQTLARKLVVALHEGERRPGFARRLPRWVRTLVTAALMTLLTSGFIDSFFLGAAVLMVFIGILLARNYFLPKLGIWTRWGRVVGKVPLAVRLASTILTGYAVTRLVLVLPGQSAALNGAPGKFGPELVSLVLGLLVALVLLPQHSDAGKQEDVSSQKGVATKPKAKVRTAQALGVDARVIVLAWILVLLARTDAYAGICLDPVCCFGSDPIAALAVAGLLLLLLILIFWPELVLLGTLLWPFIEPIFAIAAGTQAIINEVMGTLLAPLLGDLLFPAPAAATARTVAEAFAETPPVIETFAESVADAGEAELAETTPLQFGANDLVYGPSAEGGLRQLADDAGGQLLSDLPKPPDLTWTNFSLQTLDDAAQSGRMIRFDLTNIYDVNGVLDGRGQFANTVTGYELRYIEANWERFQDVVKFYFDGREVPPPWLSN